MMLFQNNIICSMCGGESEFEVCEDCMYNLDDEHDDGEREEMQAECTKCGNSCDFEICEDCFTNLEDSRNQIVSFNFEEEMKLLDQAVDESLNTNPDYLELIEIAKKESVENDTKRSKTLLELSNRHFNPSLKSVSFKNVNSLELDQVLAIDECLLEFMWKYYVKKCGYCRSKETCPHLTITEYEFFLKLRRVSKAIRDMVDRFLKDHNIGPFALTCWCCSTAFVSKYHLRTPLSWMDRTSKTWPHQTDMLVFSNGYHRFIEKLHRIGLPVYQLYHNSKL